MANDILAIYPGTFDPMTLGHEDMLHRAARMFGRITVAVAIAHHKKTLFTLEERLDMVRQAMQNYPHVQVEPFEGLVTEFAAARGAQVMVRGLRSGTDFDYEFQLAGMNRALRPEIESVFLTPSTPYQHISSTLVREIAMLRGDTAQFVSAGVQQRLSEKLRPAA
ncbi:MAG: pantetheine-phosphate adenylyltransferase [Giesbergeria sp.]|uniref:pantetheine-phosphate adenylyltransferase n=1 Tax=Giesbergeria sp. TaxID=2818473 RepID=UPI002635D36D|nr:pantetheine-phosphate adenylyltransferase [Giesbergeria sp.]MDD2610123.1 pantetheine-phosphate adenylyltransferase [Giesbergeria sp.]